MAIGGMPEVTVEIRVKVGQNETTIIQHQALDSVGRPTEPRMQVLNRAAADARSWLKRNAGNRG